MGESPGHQMSRNLGCALGPFSIGVTHVLFGKTTFHLAGPQKLVPSLLLGWFRGGDALHLSRERHRGAAAGKQEATFSH